jgi:hypothetical protein
MVNFAILSRIKARKLLAQPEAVPGNEKDALVKIVMKDVKTGKVREFESIDEAISEGFDKTNLVKALKNGSKYKGHLWTVVE